MNRLNAHLQQYYRKCGKDGWVLQCDIKGYYPNMPHEVAKKKFAKHLDEWTFAEVEKILNSFEGEIGFNPGSQLIQIAGISVLDEMDHFVKEKLRVRHYLRYMDDFLLISDDKEFLRNCLENIKEYLKERGFELNEKTSLYRISQGIKFLGFRFILTDTGKVIRLIKTESVKRERRKLRKLVRLAKKGKMTREKVDQCYESYKAHARRGNTWKMLRRLDKFYESLWKED